MAKTSMLCPFSHKLCKECAVYRGKHYYLSFCKQYRGYIGELEDDAKLGVPQHPLDLRGFEEWVEPWARERNTETRLKIRLKVIDMGSEEVRTCEFEEAKAWDWSDSETMRIIGGLQVTSWDKLVEIARFKAENGYQEVEIYQAPRFMLLGGG